MRPDERAPSTPRTHRRSSRVRTGCLICRSRKVKCDEARPNCYNCIRLNRACLYQPPLLSGTIIPRQAEHAPSPNRAHGEWEVSDTRAFTGVSATNDTGQYMSDHHDLLPGTLWFNPDLGIGSTPLNFVTGEWGDLFPATSDSFQVPDTSLSGTPVAMLQGDDVLPVERSSFSYFLSSVEPPFITPWDSFNWTIIKSYMCQLARSTPSVGAAILAVEDLYRTLLGGDDTAAALSRYFVAKSAHLSLLKDESSEMETILIVTLLLCCFEVVAQHETVSSTLKQKDLFVTRLEQRPRNQPWSPVSSRIICWLHLFHTKAMHLGGRGVLSPRLLELLPEQQPPLSLMFLQQSGTPQPETPQPDAVVCDLQQSLFQFYCELQRISTRVSGLNRHHRARGGSEDERKVEQLSNEIEQRLFFLWQGRPWILDAATDDLNCLVSCSPTKREQITLLAALCKISYHAEIVYRARGSGTLHFGSVTINSARAVIRDIVTKTRRVSSGSELDPAFIWPLFLYVVESTDSNEANWGLEAFGQLSNPLWSSAAVKELISGLSKEHISKGARVDSRYFSIDNFGAVPPFM